MELYDDYPHIVDPPMPWDPTEYPEYPTENPTEKE